jgi:hypothetical protein
MDYIYAENFEGIGQGEWNPGHRNLISCAVKICKAYVTVQLIRVAEQMICLNRGPTNTGPEWFEATISALAGTIRSEQRGRHIERLKIDIWWGLQDGMVPRKGQCRFLFRQTMPLV